MLGALLVSGQKTTWEFDPEHTDLQFKAKYLAISNVTGEFHKYEGTVITRNGKFVNADISATVKVKSIDTDIKKRDQHLRSEDFFYAKEYPLIKFESTSFTKTGESTYELTGEMTMRGVTRTETFDVVYNGTAEKNGETRAAFEVTGTVDRFDYDIDWNEKFLSGFVVSDEIKIMCDVSLIRVDN
jgi:polyisoprenoid-binding protein YceI